MRLCLTASLFRLFKFGFKRLYFYFVQFYQKFTLEKVEQLIDLVHNDVILWSRRLKSFENGYS